MNASASDPAGAPAPALLGVEAALEFASDAVAVFDADGILRITNQRFREAFAGLGGFAEIGTRWDVFLYQIAADAYVGAAPADRLRHMEEDLLDSTVPLPEVPYSSHNRMIFVRLHRLKEGAFAFVQRDEGTSQDDDAREVEALMARVLEACPANLTMARVGDGRIMYRTPAATELLGSTRDSVEHFVRREERADFITAILPDLRVDDMRIVGRKGDGSEFPASLSARLIDYRGEDVIVSNMIDLTDQIALQDELEHQRQQVFQAEKMSALGELLAGVAHELNNPLSIVVGNAMILLEETEGTEMEPRVAKMSEAAERCVRIVRSFLSMARERPLDLAPAVPADLIADAVEAFQNAEPPPACNVEVDVRGEIPAMLLDEVQFIQVVLNLLTNAEHAMTDSGIGDTTRITAALSDCDDALIIGVRDNGPGVPETIRTRVFDPLFTTKSAGKGTGIGLSFCQRVVIAHGGTLTLGRSRGTGAHFVLTFPIKPG